MERRGFLKLATGSALAAGAALTAGNFLVSLQQPTVVTVKAVYVLMSQYVNVTDEFFSLQEPASVRDLEVAVANKHPSLTVRMMDTMLIQVNGESIINSDYALKDRDEVDFIPVMAGG